MRYVQVSTDEVYGSIEEGSFTEESPLNPSSPYSATKAGADLLVASYRHTFGLEALICRGSNNYGPFQYPEKLIPLMVLNALHGDKLPVYGDGQQVRNWIYAEDFARGIGFALEHGVPGEVYNVGGPDECPNLEVVAADRRVHRRRRGADRVRHRPARPRPPLLAVLGQDPRAGLGAAGLLRRRPQADRRLVPREHGLVGADPLRRLPRLLRAPVRPLARLSGRLSRAERADLPAAAAARELERRRVLAVLARPRRGAVLPEIVTFGRRGRCSRRRAASRRPRPAQSRPPAASDLASSCAEELRADLLGVARGLEVVDHLRDVGLRALEVAGRGVLLRRRCSRRARRRRAGAASERDGRRIGPRG